MESGIAKHSVVIAGRRTSVSLEDEFWDDIRQIARGRGETLSELITSIDADRQPARNLSSAIRLFVLGIYRDRECQRGTRVAYAKDVGRQGFRGGKSLFHQAESSGGKWCFKLAASTLTA